MQASGAEAFEELRTELETVSKLSLSSPNIDVQLAAAFAHGLAIRDFEPQRRARFDSLSIAGLWDARSLESLPTVALATWYSRRQFEQVDAVAQDGRIPDETVREASEVRLRMLRVLEYHLFEHAGYGPRLAAIRSGKGYQDLAKSRTRFLPAVTGYRSVFRDTRYMEDRSTSRGAVSGLISSAGIELQNPPQEVEKTSSGRNPGERCQRGQVA